MKDLGLSDDQISTLCDGKHEARAEFFDVAPRLEPSDCAAIPVLRQTIALLKAVRTREPARATAQGNLPVVIVKELFVGAFKDAEYASTRVNREDDSGVLSRVRRLAQKAGLLSFRATAFRLTRVGRSTLDSDDYDEIYRRLFEAYLSNPGIIDRYDRIPVGSAVARCVPLLLFAARDTTGEYLYEEDMSELVVAVSDDLSVYGDDLDAAVRLRFFDRFGVHFGLFEEGPAFAPPVEVPEGSFFSHSRWRRTPLFDRVFRWHVEPPVLAVRRPEVAAGEWMAVVHDAPFELDGSEDYVARSVCLRAMERCPTDADAYVVLARLYVNRPELALTFADAGLVATTAAFPEVPDGVSAWGDHMYRDVLRLHFIKAELLYDRGRIDQAYAECEELLRIDPLDGIEAAEYYFQIAMESADYDTAQRALDRFSDDSSPTALWSATLAAFAHGDKELANARQKRAIAANPHIPEQLLAGWPVDPPDSYTPGGLDEALIYAARFHRAWKRVRGARAWLRRGIAD